MASAASLERRRARLAATLPDATELIRGTLVERRMRCGKEACRCQADPAARHGPYRLLETTVGRGRTRTLLLPAAEVRAVRAAVDRQRRIAAQLERISELNWELLARRVQRARRGEG